MTIECKNCQTRYRLDKRRVPDGGLAVRCSRCKRVYWVQKVASIEEVAPEFTLIDSQLNEIAGTKNTTPVGEKPKEALVSQRHNTSEEATTRSEHYHRQSEELVSHSDIRSCLSARREHINHFGPKVDVSGTASLGQEKEEKSNYGHLPRIEKKDHKNLGWVLLCIASSCFTFHLFKFAISSTSALSVGLIASLLGLFYLLIDRMKFELRESLLVFGWGFLIGTFLRAISMG